MSEINPCPRCGDKNIVSIEDYGACPCRCSCWSYPVCCSCGFSLYRVSANSDGTDWVDFVMKIWYSYEKHSKELQEKYPDGCDYLQLGLDEIKEYCA